MKHSLLILTAFLCAAAGANAIDLTPFIAQLAPIYYNGTLLQYDSGNSETDQVFYDLNGQLAVPAFEIEDLGANAILIVWSVDHPYGNQVWQGNDPASCGQALTSAGFNVGINGSGTQQTGTSFSQSDQSNLQGLYQVGLWVFGAVLMLPIILKVKPG